MDHMHCQVYHENIDVKRAKNDAYLILKSFTDTNIVRGNEKGGKLNIFLDNCSEQNKKNIVLR